MAIHQYIPSLRIHHQSRDDTYQPSMAANILSLSGRYANKLCIHTQLAKMRLTRHFVVRSKQIFLPAITKRVALWCCGNLPLAPFEFIITPRLSESSLAVIKGGEFVYVPPYANERAVNHKSMVRLSTSKVEQPPPAIGEVAVVS